MLSVTVRCNMPNKHESPGLRATLLLFAALWSGAICAEELTQRKYQAAEGQRGVVLLGVNWGRAWNYCGFENVQLQGLSFDRMPITRTDDSSPSDIRLKGPKLTAEPVSVTYALLLDPGEYALTGFHIKAAASIKDIGAFRASRSELIKDGVPLAGSFDVAAGEIVYIGNFAPDCPQQNHPVVWRYYLKDVAAFRQYVDKLKGKYPYLDLDATQYRLFKTTTIGNDFELPSE